MKIWACRWKRNEKGEKVQKDGKYILEFVAIQRTDNKEWAIPGVRGTSISRL